MPKIKNWSKNERLSRTGKGAWNHDKLPIRLRIYSSSSIGGGKYEVRLDKVLPNGSTTLTTLKKNVDTLEDAKEWSVKWMKNNPNGPKGLKVNVSM
jgi:hypothetical protein